MSSHRLDAADVVVFDVAMLVMVANNPIYHRDVLLSKKNVECSFS